MSRPQTSVRRVEQALCPTVLDLWTSYRVEAGMSPDAAARTASEAAVRTALAGTDVTAFVAFVEGRPAGLAVVSDPSGNPFAEANALTLDLLYVLREERRHGVARALMAAATAYADRAGADQVVSNVPGKGRDANRFFARLGFTPMSTRRLVTTTVLHRRLVGEAGTGHSLDRVLARRRSARIRAAQQGGAAH